MKLNHINLTVSNVADAIQFFESYFSFKCIGIKGDNLIAVLLAEDGFELVLMSSLMNQNGNVSYPDSFHIGFMTDNEDEVFEFHQKLKDGGIITEDNPKKIRDRFGFYFYYDNIMIEIAVK